MERFLGINIEYEQTDKKALRALVYASRLYGKLSGIQIEGELPQTGPAILVANHVSSLDILKMAHVCFSTSGRVIRGIARDSLLNPYLDESEEVLERTGKQNEFWHSKTPLAMTIRRAVGFTLNGIGAIPIRRGAVDTRAIKQIDAVLEDGQIVGIFIQETRVKAGTLIDLKGGAAYVAMKHPDIPIILAGIWPRPFGNRVVVASPTFLESNGQKVDSTALKYETVKIADGIAKLLPDPIRSKWEKEDRVRYLNPQEIVS